MKKQLYESRGRFTASLLLIALTIIVVLLFYTEKMVDDLRKESRGILQFYAGMIAKAASDTTEVGLSFIFENIIKDIYFPIIVTSEQNEPISWKGIGVPDDDRSDENVRKVKKILGRMQKLAKPIPIAIENPYDPLGSPLILNYIYYSDSSTITRLRILPYIEIGIVGLFIFIGFIGFSTIKRSEQRFIWVGMSKETAHQLGTPISSLLGWVQLLRERSYKRPETIKVINEMDQDVNRLGKVAERFSQIGSTADLKDQNIHLILKNVKNYIQRRLPQMKKTIEIKEHLSEVPLIPLNSDLIEWVIENLIKNSVDAINHDNGLIKIETGLSDQKKYTIFVDIIDNGRGIAAKKKSHVFRPGFSTKKRGWGLGLNLAKRIVEEYHHGKLMVKESQTGVGTTMRVYL